MLTAPIHAFRTLVLDDQWRDDLSQGSSSISLLVEMVFGVKAVFSIRRGTAPSRLVLTGNARQLIRAAWITGGYPSVSLGSVGNSLAWRYGENDWPVGLRDSKQAEAALTLEWPGKLPPVGFYLGTDTAADARIVGYSGRRELFVVPFWPFDHLDDLIGARDHWCRFWNVLVLDNLLYKNELRGCQLSVARDAPDPFGGDKAVHLFTYFRKPPSYPDRDVLWMPDRQTQAIIESSQVTNWEETVVGRKVWPRFQLDKRLATSGRIDEAVKEYETYQQCLDNAPRSLPWCDFVTRLDGLAHSVQRWQSPPIDSLTDTHGVIERIAATDYPVFFVGAPGTGKSFLAKAIHDMSLRAQDPNSPFLEVNCGAIPKEGNFFESTLFGMEENALGRGSPEQKGVFREANNGTLFLDEVHHLPKHLQGALLTFIDNAHFRPLGGKEDTVDIRIIAATNEHEIIEKTFTDPEHSPLRPDFLQRIAFHSIQLEPLSKRTEQEFCHICFRVFSDVKQRLSTGFGRTGSASQPFTHIDPTLREHIRTIRLAGVAPQELHLRVMRDDLWRRQFDVGGNIRFLKQLLTKAIIKNWGQEEIAFRHIEQAFEIEKLRLVDDPAQASDVQDSNAITSALRDLVGAFGDVGTQYEKANVDADFRAALHTLALWCIPSPLFDSPPKFDAWITRPHTLGLGWERLTPVVSRTGEKWKVLLIFAFLRYLQHWSIEIWQKKKGGVDPKIKRICSDRQASEAGVAAQVEQVWTVLGYKRMSSKFKGATRQSRLTDLLQVWVTRPGTNANGAIFEPGQDAKREYVESLVQRLRDDVPSETWAGKGPTGLKAGL